MYSFLTTLKLSTTKAHAVFLQLQKELFTTKQSIPEPEFNTYTVFHYFIAGLFRDTVLETARDLYTIKFHSLLESFKRKLFFEATAINSLVFSKFTKD